MKSSYYTSKTNSYVASEIGSAADTWDACIDYPTSTVNINETCLKPTQHNGSYKIIASGTNQPRGDRAANNSTGGCCTNTTNTSESIGSFKPVEFAAINPIGWSADQKNSTYYGSFKHTRIFWSRSINGTKSIVKNLRRTDSRDSIT
jgi:hypothetical protein